MPPEGSFTVPGYIFLYVWERESKNLTFQMKRKMKGRDRVSLIENKREGACCAGKLRETSPEWKYWEAIEALLPVLMLESVSSLSWFSLIPDPRASSLFCMFMLPPSPDPEALKVTCDWYMLWRSFLVWDLFLQSLETHESSRAVFGPTRSIFSSCVLQSFFAALAGVSECTWLVGGICSIRNLLM